MLPQQETLFQLSEDKQSEIPCIFGYVGQKRGLIECYPPPTRGVIVEPFAGSAGYARRWGAGRRVILVEKVDWLAKMWQWLVRADPYEILDLPLLEDIPSEGLNAMTGLRPEARSLIGIKLCLGTNPANLPTMMGRHHRDTGIKMFWNEQGRQAVADAVPHIRQWEIIHGDYRSAPDIDATWFVDPPYERLPDMYGARVSDYQDLGHWCRSRRGQVIVCEDERARWLPFKPLNMERRSKLNSSSSGRFTGQANKHREGVWYGGS